MDNNPLALARFIALQRLGSAGGFVAQTEQPVPVRVLVVEFQMDDTGGRVVARLWPNDPTNAAEYGAACNAYGGVDGAAVRVVTDILRDMVTGAARFGPTPKARALEAPPRKPAKDDDRL